MTPGPALAHVASAEGIICVEKIAGKNPEPLDYNNIPGCTYCSPEVASVGYTEKAAKEKGYELKVGKFPFSASGKASAAGAKDGFVKLIFDAKYGELLGAHMIGMNVTEMIAECVALRKLETTGLKEKLLAAHRNGIKTVLIPKDNRKDLREIPRRVLKAIRIVLVDHMDDVLREALALTDPDKMFGARRLFMEYRNGELVGGDASSPVPPPVTSGDVPGEQPGMS